MLYHFVGASPNSTDPRQMLLRLCRELARHYGFGDDIPQDDNERQGHDLIVTSLRLVDQGFIMARQLKAARKSLSTARDWRRPWRTRHGDPCRLSERCSLSFAGQAWLTFFFA